MTTNTSPNDPADSLHAPTMHPEHSRKKSMNRLCIYRGVLTELATPCSSKGLLKFSQVFLKFSYYIIIYVGIFSVIGIVVLKFLNRDVIRLLPPLILPNTGNMGIPICLFAYGNSGLAIATAITSIILVLHFSLNILLSSKKFSIEPLIKCVPVYALLFSLIFVYFKIPAPKFLENATFLIGYSTIFLVLMSVGIALSKIKVFNFGNHFRDFTYISDIVSGIIKTLNRKRIKTNQS